MTKPFQIILSGQHVLQITHLLISATEPSKEERGNVSGCHCHAVPDWDVLRKLE